MKGHTIQFVIRREFVRGSAKSKGPDMFLLYRKIS